MINYLLIGGAGFIGSSIAHQLVKKTDCKVSIYEPNKADISRLSDILDKVDLIRGNLSNINSLQDLITNNGINTIIHLVSTLIPGSTYDDYKAEFENVIFPTVELMKCCADKNIKFIYFSSGGTIYGNNPYGMLRENDAPSPISYYGLSKQILEDSVLFEHRRSGLQYLIIRPSNPYGYGQRLYGKQGLIAVLLGKIIKGEKIQIWGDGKNVRDYIFIDDFVDMFGQLLNNSIINQIVNIGSGHGYSTNDIINKLVTICDKEIEIEYVESRAVDVDSMVLDISTLKKYTKIRHTHLEEGIRDFYNKVIDK